MEQTKFVGVDCGETSSGVVVLTEDGIKQGYNIPNHLVMQFILDEADFTRKGFRVIIEDVRPYNMRITDGIIKTIKFIGQLEWRLQEAAIDYTLIARWEVKQWVFNSYRKEIEPDIIKKIEYSRKRKAKAGKPIGKRVQTPSFIYVDDRLVQKAMRLRWGIEKQKKVGEKAPFGLKDHSWQALGVISVYISLHKPFDALT